MKNIKNIILFILFLAVSATVCFNVCSYNYTYNVDGFNVFNYIPTEKHNETKPYKPNKTYKNNTIETNEYFIEI